MDAVKSTAAQRQQNWIYVLPSVAATPFYLLNSRWLIKIYQPSEKCPISACILIVNSPCVHTSLSLWALALKLRQLHSIRRSLPKSSSATSSIMTKVDYCNVALAGLPQCDLDRLQTMVDACRLKFDHITPPLINWHWLWVTDRILYKFFVYWHIVTVLRVEVPDRFDLIRRHNWIATSLSVCINHAWSYLPRDDQRPMTVPSQLLHHALGTISLKRCANFRRHVFNSKNI